jgi:hypothetical protein
LTKIYLQLTYYYFAIIIRQTLRQRQEGSLIAANENEIYAARSQTQRNIPAEGSGCARQYGSLYSHPFLIELTRRFFADRPPTTGPAPCTQLTPSSAERARREHIARKRRSR